MRILTNVQLKDGGWWLGIGNHGKISRGKQKHEKGHTEDVYDDEKHGCSNGAW